MNEYVCLACGIQFSASAKDEEKPAHFCPFCGANNIEEIFSMPQRKQVKKDSKKNLTQRLKSGNITTISGGPNTYFDIAKFEKYNITCTWTNEDILTPSGITAIENWRGV